MSNKFNNPNNNIRRINPNNPNKPHFNPHSVANKPNPDKNTSNTSQPDKKSGFEALQELQELRLKKPEIPEIEDKKPHIEIKNTEKGHEDIKKPDIEDKKEPFEDKVNKLENPEPAKIIKTYDLEGNEEPVKSENDYENAPVSEVPLKYKKKADFGEDEKTPEKPENKENKSLEEFKKDLNEHIELINIFTFEGILKKALIKSTNTPLHSHIKSHKLNVFEDTLIKFRHNISHHERIIIENHLLHDKPLYGRDTQTYERVITREANKSYATTALAKWKRGIK